MFIELDCLFGDIPVKRLVNIQHIIKMDTIMSTADRNYGGRTSVTTVNGTFITKSSYTELKLLIMGAKPESVQVLYGDKNE